MRQSIQSTASLLAAAAAFLLPAVSTAQIPARQIQIRQIEVLKNPKLVEIEIQTSERAVPQTQVLTSPDRLVVDFPNAVPSAQLRNQPVKRGEVKSLRVSLFAAKPPVTRVVLDLNGPQPYQIFPNGRSVIVKVGAASAAESAVSNASPADSTPVVKTPMVKLSNALASGSAPQLPAAHAATLGLTTKSGATNKIHLTNAAHVAQPVPIPKPVLTPAPPPLAVSFQGGLLSIKSERASLSDILFAVQQRTGADIAIPAGSEQEQVVVELGPAPAPEVLAHLLNGSKFNFLIISSPTNPGALDRVILSQRSSLLLPLPPPQTPTQIRPAQPPPDEEPTEPEVLPQPPPQPPQETPNPTQPPPTPPDR